MVKKRKDIAKIVSDRLNVNIHTADDCVLAIIDNVMEWVANGDEIQLRGFGVLKTQKRKAKKARVISRNEVITVPEHVKPKFKASDKFMEMCNGKA